MNTDHIRAELFEGLVIPAIPLALHVDGSFDERRQRALLRYYIDAGAGGIAAAVHTTQFEIREHPRFFEEFLDLVAEEIDSFSRSRGKEVLKIGGVTGTTPQAVREARLLRQSGFDAALLSLSAFPTAGLEELIGHCRRVAEQMPLFGFYLQTAVGGIQLPYEFWRELAEIPDVVGIKVAPFDRYQTLEVMRAVSDSGRGGEIALYTGNDDSIVFDLLSDYPFPKGDMYDFIRFAGGLLGQWCVWTRKSVELLEEIKQLRAHDDAVPFSLFRRAQELTDANAAIFDARTSFSGVIPGVHEVLRRQGLLETRRCIDPDLDLSPGQKEEIDRVEAAYPHLRDDAFVAEHLEEWLS